MKREEPSNKDILLFELSCINCGKVIFTLPYKLDTCHSITCQECKEINIVNVFENGSIAFGTIKQRDAAFKRIKKLIKNQLRDYVPCKPRGFDFIEYGRWPYSKYEFHSIILENEYNLKFEYLNKKRTHLKPAGFFKDGTPRQIPVEISGDPSNYIVELTFSLKGFLLNLFLVEYYTGHIPKGKNAGFLPGFATSDYQNYNLLLELNENLKEN